jgi:hypothetical protein
MHIIPFVSLSALHYITLNVTRVLFFFCFFVFLQALWGIARQALMPSWFLRFINFCSLASLSSFHFVSFIVHHSL